MELQDISNRIATCRWVYSALLPHVRTAFSRFEAQPAAPEPLTVLSARRYQGADRVPTWQYRRSIVDGIALINDRQDPLADVVMAVLPKSAPLVDDQSFGIDGYGQALALINDVDATTYLELKLGIEFIATVRSQDFRSCSSPKVLGCIITTTKAHTGVGGELATPLVHELAHQELFLLNLFDRLILLTADDELSHAPFQGRIRPAIGRMHSLAALMRMIVFRRLIGLDCKEMVEMLKGTAASLNDSLLTPFGCSLP